MSRLVAEALTIKSNVGMAFAMPTFVIYQYRYVVYQYRCSE